MKQKLLLRTLAALFALNSLAPAQQLQIRAYGTRDGMPQSEVDVIYQDRAGQIWFGTFENGLARYDGKTMQAFALEQGLPNLSIRSIFEDREENIWVGTEGGLACIQRCDRVQAFTQGHGLPSNVINYVTEDSSGELWLATAGGLCKRARIADSSSQARALQFAFQNYAAEGDIAITALAAGANDSLWLGTSDGLRLFQKDKFLPLPEAAPLAGRFVRDLLLTRGRVLWAGTTTGLFRWQNNKIEAFTKKEGLSEEEIFCLAEDHNGNLWLGTRTCLLKYDGTAFTRYDGRHGLPNSQIRGLLVDYENNLWLGTWGGGAGKIYGWAITNYDHRSGLKDNAVFSLMQDRERRIWIGTNGGGATIISGEKTEILNTDNVLPDNVVRGMTQTPNGDIWVATHGGAARLRHGQWQRFTASEGMPDVRLRHVYAAPNGDIWFGSAFQGALRYRQNRFTSLNASHGLPGNSVHQIHQDRKGRLWIATNQGLYMENAGQDTVFSTRNGLPDNTVYTVFEDHNGAMWFGTRVGGAARFLGDRFEVFDANNGLPNNVVYFIAEDEQQRIWFGTNAGASCFDGKNFFHLNASDGLLDDECNTRAVMKDAEGHLWIGTIGGASRLATALLPATSPRPRVKITALEFNGNEYRDLRAERRRVPYHATVTLHFATLSHLNEDKVQSSVRLDGFEAWQHVKQDRTIRYTNLPPGRYNFYARGVNALGVASTQDASVEFQVLAPFYLTYWFFALSALALAGLVFGGHRWRVRHVKARARELEKAVALKTEELQHTLTFLATVKDFLPLGLLVVDAEENIVEANRAALEMFEYDLDELRRQKLPRLLQSPLSNRAALWRALTQKKAGLEMPGLTASGKHFICEIHSDRVLDDKDKLRFLILTCENIEAQKQLEQRILDHEKQSTLVNLVVGMGEALNQKLASVTGQMKTLHEHLGANGANGAAAALHHAQTGAQEMDKVLRQLLEFTAYLTKTPSIAVDLRQELRSLMARWQEKIAVALPPMNETIPIRILPKLRDGLDEAMQNALDAGADKINVEVEVMLDHARVRVLLSDNGEGVSPEVRNKAFMPFFKTRATPHAGLGLWKLYQVVQQCGGSVELESLPSRGTQLRLTLPLDTAKYHANIATVAEEERHAKFR